MKMPPKVIAKSADRPAGVLPVNAVVRAGANKPPAARLKLEVRRLPPGLTLTELEEVLGDEWKLGNGKVDWREYRQGKSRTTGYGKVPEQSRCYIHLSNEGFVKEFEKRFLEVVFHDKAGTHKNPDIKHLPPTLGFAPNQRTPFQQARPRTDNRQGTIDQDPEFISFLESETQPIAKPAAIDSSLTEKGSSMIKSTPLIDDLREKKANKAKAAQAKAEKSKEKKGTGAKAASKDVIASGPKETASKQQKAEQGGKDTSKASAKAAAGKQQQQQAHPAKQQTVVKTKKQSTSQLQKDANAAPSQPAHGPGTKPTPSAQKTPRQRGNTDGIKRMLQKDLGIRPKTAVAAPGAQAGSGQSAGTSSTGKPTSSTGPSQKDSAKNAEKSKPSTPSTTEKKVPQTKAYLKHANPSQGMTEVLIQAALAKYGTVANVTIDPRKGTAIAMFENSEGLSKALEAKRVPVANGAIEVLEFRDRSGGGGASRGGFRSGRGGRGGREAGTGSNPSSSAASTAAPTKNPPPATNPTPASQGT